MAAFGLGWSDTKPANSWRPTPGVTQTGTGPAVINVGDLTAFMVAGQGPLFGRMRAVEPYPEIVRAIDLVGR